MSINTVSKVMIGMAVLAIGYGVGRFLFQRTRPIGGNESITNI